jgi:hypothetical protein
MFITHFQISKMHQKMQQKKITMQLNEARCKQETSLYMLTIIIIIIYVLVLCDGWFDKFHHAFVCLRNEYDSRHFIISRKTCEDATVDYGYLVFG